MHSQGGKNSAETMQSMADGRWLGGGGACSCPVMDLLVLKDDGVRRERSRGEGEDHWGGGKGGGGGGGGGVGELQTGLLFLGDGAARFSKRGPKSLGHFPL